MLQGEDGFDQAGDPGRRAGVTDVALDAPEGAEAAQALALPPHAGAKSAGEGRHLDGVADRGRAAVGLDVLHALGSDTGELLGAGDGRRLAGLSGGGVADLPGAVVVDRRRSNDGADGVAGSEGGSERL